MFIESPAMGLVRVNEIPVKSIIGKAAENIIHQCGGHVEFIRFKEYYGMPRGHSLSIYARFLGKKRTVYFRAKR